MNLSKPQELIWDMERFAGGSVAVICTSVLRKGQGDERALQSAVNHLFRCNDALRTRIHVNGPDITQYVTDPLEQPSEVLHFSDTAELSAYAESYAKTAIGLSGPLCEIKILVLPDRYGLLVKIHHIVADAWTMALLATQFNMLMDGKTPQCYSYQSYCEKEAAYQNSKRHLADKQFFLDQTEQCDTPVFIRDQRVGSLLSKRETFVIPAQDAVRIRDFSNQVNCSVFSLFATALAAYISRIRGNAERFYIGTTVLNRMNVQELHTAGMFVNTVPVLLTAAPDMTFLETLEQTDDRIMSVFRHQRYHYGDLLRDMQGKPASGGRLFDVMLNYMNAAVGGTQQETESVWYHNGMQNESLQIHFDDRDREGVLRINYDYQTEKFSKDEILQLHTHLMNLLLDGMARPQAPFCKLNMLSAAEEQQLCVGFNRTAMAYSVPAASTIFSLFEETARKHADKTCISFDGKHLRYDELLHISEALDSVIRTFTHNEKTVIAVIAERSIQMYCAIYGIIRGGNAYLPIAPDNPQDRISYMLKNSGATLVLAQEQFVHLANGVACINISDLLKNPPTPEAIVPCAALQTDTAYVIYTSGSTGRPKGVKIDHRAAVNRILWMEDTYPLEKDGVILQKTPYSFDVSVWEIFWWGMCGGRLAVSKPGEHFLPANILNEVSHNRVTHLHFVPSVFDLFLGYLENNKADRSKFASVKHVFVSGEALDPALVKRFYALYDHESVQLHNLYGPTECAVDVTYYDCRPTDQTVPIGMPIYNTQIYIADKYLNLLPPGIMGELLVGGYNVGQGYVNDPILTASRFVDNPFGDGKLYKTGDLAYRRGDGQIIFCGRMDSQVKLNGQRVETGEIEAIIKSVPGVDAVAVIMRMEHGQNVLAAYYCSDGHMEESIQAACREKLPGYMVPKQLLRIDRIPLHPNGKLDRQALEGLAPNLLHPDVIEPPVDAVEQRVCEAFQAVLGKGPVGRNSDFFDLGGTSLSMIRLLAESGYESIIAAQFIENATPAKLTALLKSRQPRRVNFVETLYQAQAGRRAYVLFPFAGGDAEAYIRLADSIKQLDHSVSLYFIRYLHTDAQCEKAAEELAELLAEYEVYFYSHCAGSAVALRILHFLEEKHPRFVKHYFAAASTPFRTVGAKNVWHYVPDKFLLQVLKKAGAPTQMLPAKQIPEILNRFRADTDFAAQFFAKSGRSVSCPVSLIIGKGDLFTRFCRRPELRWKQYGQCIREVYCIDTPTHYFQAQNSEQIAHILLSVPKDSHI